MGKTRPIVDGKIQTQTGRWIDAPPAVPLVLAGHPKVIQTLANWLVLAAQAEAMARHDDYNGFRFLQLNPRKLAPVDWDELNDYLFGEECPTFKEE